MRTNVLIDDTLMETAMRTSGLKTKKDVIETALQEFIKKNMCKDLLDLQGQIQFVDDYDYKAIREGR